MTTYYVDSASGSATAPYDTWGKAATSLATISAINVAGDTVYVASTHSESIASAVSYAWNGSPKTNPVLIICADKTSGAPPITPATGATITTTGNNAITLGINFAAYYMYGMTFVMGSGSASDLTLTDGSGGYAVLEQCSLQIATTGSLSLIDLQAGRLVDCSVKFAATGQAIKPKGAYVTVEGLTLLAGGTSPTSLFNTYLPSLCRNLDLTNGAIAINVCNSMGSDAWSSRLAYVKVPASWIGLVDGNSRNAGSPGVLWTTEWIDNAGTNYKLRAGNGYGNLVQDVSTYRTGGASDATTPYSWQVFGLNGRYPHSAFYTPEILLWNETVGSPVTLTVEYGYVTSVSAPQTNARMWLEVQYFSNSGSPLGARASSGRSLLGTATANASSTATWNNAPANKAKLSVTVTPQQKGFFVGRIGIATSTSRANIDPYMTAS